MNLNVTTSDDCTLVSVIGRIDTINAGEFETSMIQIIEKGCPKLILDCSGLTYISSSGLRIFLVIQKKMRALKGHFSLCNLSPSIKEIFDISGFSSIFSVLPARDSELKG